MYCNGIAIVNSGELEIDGVDTVPVVNVKKVHLEFNSIKVMAVESRGLVSIRVGGKVTESVSKERRIGSTALCDIVVGCMRSSCSPRT